MYVWIFKRKILDKKINLNFSLKIFNKNDGISSLYSISLIRYDFLFYEVLAFYPIF